MDRDVGFMSTLYAYLGPFDQLQLASTSHHARAALQYQHVLLSVLFGGTKLQGKKLEATMACWRDGFIHAPSPVRLLRLAAGTRCENKGCSAPVNALATPLCLHLCSSCIQSLTSIVPEEHPLRQVFSSEYYLRASFMKQYELCGMAVDIELSNSLNGNADDIIEYVEGLPSGVDDVIDIFEKALEAVRDNSNSDDITGMLCRSAHTAAVWNDIKRRMPLEAWEWFADTSVGQLSLQKYPPNPLTSTEDGRHEIAWSVGFSYSAIRDAHLMTDDFFNENDAFHKWLKRWRQETCANNPDQGYPEHFVNVVSISGANDIAMACVNEDKISALCIALTQSELNGLNMSVAFQECNRLNERLIVGPNVELFVASEVWLNAFQYYVETTEVHDHRDAAVITEELEKLYYATVNEHKELCKRISELLQLRWVSASVRRRVCNRKKDDAIRNELKALFADEKWTCFVMNQPFVVELLLNRDYATFYEITTAENFGQELLVESEDCMDL